MKRLTAVLLTLVMLFTMTCAVCAQDTVMIAVGAVKGEIGDVVEVPVTVSEGHYLVNGRIFLSYDPTVLELQKVCDDADNPYFESVNTEILDSSFMWAFGVPKAGKANFVFATTADTGNTAGGTLYTLTFKLLKKAESAIAVTVPEMCSNSGSGDADTALTLENGSVSVTFTDPTPAMKGDINGDGKVNLNDATRLFYYVNGLLEITDQQKLNAELNDDGEVNLSDASRLFYHVSGLVDL